MLNYVLGRGPKNSLGEERRRADRKFSGQRSKQEVPLTRPDKSGHPFPLDWRVRQLSLNTELYQGTAPAVPTGGKQNGGFSRCGRKSGAKAQVQNRAFLGTAEAWLKPYPDTRATEPPVVQQKV